MSLDFICELFSMCIGSCQKVNDKCTVNVLIVLNNTSYITVEWSYGLLYLSLLQLSLLQVSLTVL